MGLSACQLPTIGVPSQGGNSQTSSSENSSSVSSTISSSKISSSDISSEDTTTYPTVASVRNNFNVGEIVTVEGIVVKHNYTGQSTPYITGFWLADATGSIYIYGEDTAKSVKEGNKVVIEGETAYYIPTNDTGAASSMNYTGMMQLKNVSLKENDNKVNEIPESAITETTVSELNNIPLSTNITGNIYRVKGRYSRVQPADFTNYYLYDLNRKDSIMAYTQSNGKDYAWTDNYDGKTVEMLIIVSIGKPGVNSWRMCPVSFLDDDVKVSALEEATYAAERALDNFDLTYNVNTTVELSKEDEYLAGSKISISSSSNQISVEENTSSLLVHIKTTTLGKITIKATVEYDGASASKEKEIEIVKRTDFDTVTIAEARKMEKGSEVTLEAVIAKITYKSSMVKQGLFLVDETGSFFAYFGTSVMDQLETLEDGYKIIVKGTIDRYIKDATNAANENYDGDLQLSNGEILDVDKNIYDIPETSYTRSTISELAATKPTTNITGNIYLVKAKVQKNVSAYATSYSLYDSEDTSKYVPLYSQVSGADFTWLDEYDGQVVDILLGIQNLNLKKSNSFYRGCPIKVL